MARQQQATHFHGDIERQIGFSQTVQADGVLYLSGLIAVDASLAVIAPGDMAGQIDAVYAALNLILAHHRLSLEHVVKETIYVTQFDALRAALPVRLAAYDAARAYPPACTMVQISGLFLSEAMIELEAIAHVSR